jgi:hypothetical protein
MFLRGCKYSLERTKVTEKVLIEGTISGPRWLQIRNNKEL